MAGAAAEEAQRREADAAADLKRAKAALVALDGADGQADCPTCGQQLTESHLAEERHRRAEDVARLTDIKAVATKAHQECKARVKELSAADEKLAGRERDLTDRTRDAATSAAQSTKEIERSSRACATSYAALPADLRTRIAPAPPEDWAATARPASSACRVDPHG